GLRGGLDRDPASNGSGVCARGRCIGLRPDLAGCVVLHEHADQLHIAPFWARRILSEGRGTRQYFHRRYLPIGMAIPGAAIHSARLGDGIPRYRAMAPANHDCEVTPQCNRIEFPPTYPSTTSARHGASIPTSLSSAVVRRAWQPPTR